MTTTPTPADLDTLRAEVASLRAAQRRAERRARLSFALAFAAVGLTLLLNVRPPALAQTPGTSLAGLLADVGSMATRLATVEQKVTAVQNTVTSVQDTVTALQTTALTPAQAAVLSTMTLSTDPTRADGKPNTELTLTGVNVHLVSGSGRTDDGTTNGVSRSPLPGTRLTGLGNLIIGYDGSSDPRASGRGDVRTGSHNLILGDQNNYSSFGGLVAGKTNSVTGPYDTVSGGQGNVASFEGSSVSGGVGNQAAFDDASVTGGIGNTASGFVSSVSGGLQNTASGGASVVTGGLQNTAGDSDVVSGGEHITVTTPQGAWAAGGSFSPSGPGVFHSP